MCVLKFLKSSTPRREIIRFGFDMVVCVVHRVPHKQMRESWRKDLHRYIKCRISSFYLTRVNGGRLWLYMNMRYVRHPSYTLTHRTRVGPVRIGSVAHEKNISLVRLVLPTS